MAKKTGVKNYRNDILIDMIESIKPSGAEAWKQVAVLYQNATNEAELRDSDDIKRHWTQKLCNGFRPTGRSGSDKDRILRCLNIQHKIMDASAASMYGFEEGTSGSEDDHDEGDSAADEEDLEDLTLPGPATIPITSPAASPAANGSAPERPNAIAEPTHAATSTARNAAKGNDMKTKNSGSAQRYSIAKSVDSIATALAASVAAPAPAPPVATNQNDALLLTAAMDAATTAAATTAAETTA